MVISPKLLACVFACFWALTCGLEVPSSQTITQIKDDMVAYFANEKEEFIPAAVRLVFHDCIGPACNGCINNGNNANNGLDGFVDEVEPLCQSYSASLSRADCWQLLGIAAIEQAIKINNNLLNSEQIITDPIDFYWGRRDCSFGPYEEADHMFPPGTLDWKGDKDFFRKEFGLSPIETIAIIGAHTLGEAELDNSDFGSKMWTPGEETAFNNKFFQNLVSIDWTQEENSNGKFQWTGEDDAGNEGFALPSDLALLRKLEIEDGETGESTCDIDCKDSPLANWVYKFATDQMLWIEWYKRAHLKMTSKTDCNVKLEYIPYE